MRLAVNPTRMELLRLRKRLEIARRGHHLLRDKMEELMRTMTALVEKVREQRHALESKYTRWSQHALIVRAGTEPFRFHSLAAMPTRSIRIDRTSRSLFNLRIPQYRWLKDGSLESFTGESLSLVFGRLVEQGDLLLENILALSADEKTFELLAQELEKTRRRVNALEHILIPNLIETIRFIYAKLEELERDSLSRLMKVKQIIRK